MREGEIGEDEERGRETRIFIYIYHRFFVRHMDAVDYYHSSRMPRGEIITEDWYVTPLSPCHSLASFLLMSSPTLPFPPSLRPDIPPTLSPLIYFLLIML